LKIDVYYDKECPFCNSYANFLKIKEKHELVLFNARDCKKQIDGFKKLEFDINNGFIISVDNINIYQGVDAIVFLNDVAQNKVFFPDNYFFRNIVYPILKYLRKIILLISGKSIDI
jgi:predicted DCC family thiol-disulfide oxidoreductase YuxK